MDVTVPVLLFAKKCMQIQADTACQTRNILCMEREISIFMQIFLLITYRVLLLYLEVLHIRRWRGFALFPEILLRYEETCKAVREAN